MKSFLIILKSLIVLMLLSSYSHSVVSAPAPASSNVLSQISSSMSHSAVNSNNVITNSNNVTSSVISSTELKEEIKQTADELGLEVDENAVEILSDESTDEASAKEIAVAMEGVKDNIEELHDLVMTMDGQTMVYDSGWMDLEKVTTGTNGLSYSSDKNVFQDGVVQQGRGKVYVNFNKGLISADMYTRITLKGESQISHEWNSGTAGINAVPIVASTVRALNSDGTTDFDEFVDVNSSMQVDSDTLAPNYDDGFTKQNQMDRFNHDTSNGDAEKRVFMYGKFITTTPSGESGTGTIVLEGAHDAAAAATDDGTTTYIGTIERFEGSATIVGSALK